MRSLRVPVVVAIAVASALLVVAGVATGSGPGAVSVRWGPAYALQDGPPDVLAHCEAAATPLYFTPRPTLSVPAKREKRVRFEVYSGRPDKVDPEFWAKASVELAATGTVAPANVAGARRAVWTVPVDLRMPDDPKVRRDPDAPTAVPSEFAWRTRDESTDRAGEWSAWRTFEISLVIKAVHDCRLTSDDIYYAWAYGGASGRDFGEMRSEYAHARRLREAFETIRTQHPGEFTAAGDGHSANRPEDYLDGSGEWIVFRGPVPPEAAALLAEVSSRPFDQGGSALEILAERGYDQAGEQTRVRLAEEAAGSVAEHLDARGRMNSRTGVLELEVTSALDDSHYDDLRRRIVEAIAARTGLRVVVAARDSRGDATTLPVRFRLGEHGEFGHG